jgi:hypothetical protein
MLLCNWQYIDALDIDVFESTKITAEYIRLLEESINLSLVCSFFFKQ